MGFFSLRRASLPVAQPWTRPWSPHRRQLVRATHSEVNSSRVFYSISPEVPKGSRVVPCSSPPLVKPQRNLRVYLALEELALGLTSKPNARFPRDGPEALSTPFQRCLSAPPRLPTKSEQRICLRRGKKSATSRSTKYYRPRAFRRAKMASC